MVDSPTLLAVPNFSEGTAGGTIEALEAAAALQASVLDRHSDATHNRTVLTLAAEFPSLIDAVTSAAQLAIDLIDMRSHRGAHPCVGAIDVAPVVFHRPALEPVAMDAARTLAERLAGLGLPVFLYGALASTPARAERAFFRQGGLPRLTERMASGELHPDLGRLTPHPTAGAVLVTARPPLAAFNLELEGASMTDASEIARRLRESGGGLPGVRAIAIDIPGERVQISTNVHDPVDLPLARVVEAVRELARTHGADVVATELLGLVPAAALEGFPTGIPSRTGDSSERVIESRLGS